MSGMKKFNQFGSPTNAETATNTQHVVTINDQSDAPDTIHDVSGRFDVTESASAASTITLDHISLSIGQKDLWFSYRSMTIQNGIPGLDYTALDGAFKIAAGSTTPATGSTTNSVRCC